MAKNLARRATPNTLTGLVMGLAVAAFLMILTGCGGSEPDPDEHTAAIDARMGVLPVNCAASAVCK